MLHPDSWIVARLADRSGATVVRRAIRALQQRDNGETHAHWPHLRTLWDEICIQVQGEESDLWSAYLEEVDTYLLDEINWLPRIEKEAMWMQTSEGTDWEFDEDRQSNGPPVFDQDILSFVRPNLLGKAADWSNPAIRSQQDADGQRYLEEDR